ncbi:protein kintoun [Antennarius striatus]|uniref:protein kintoun n=1 Tax=Antennarius striatus TaxID=241820 RepID=UPI0035AEFD3A
MDVTEDEIDQLARALKEKKFREMLCEYAQELSDPENNRRYEKEIDMMEQDRDQEPNFFYPQPFRCLKTSMNNKQKCFINICSSEAADKPYTTPMVEKSRQEWTLPHFLSPGRSDRDPKGNKFMIYDITFHPETLDIASKNVKFMETLVTIAVATIQKVFKVTLDKKNVTEIKTKYKGAIQPGILRSPSPGHENKEPSEEHDPLALPNPDENRTATPPQAALKKSLVTTDSSEAHTQEKTTPNHTIKYRSFIDIQDFSCSRTNSVKSSRPKEIVVTIDLPLLKAANDASLEIQERRLLLESDKPAYRLELPLTYPVDGDKGEAKFNKQKGQLTVTLPVLLSCEVSDFAVGPAETAASDDERQEKREAVEVDTWMENEKGGDEEEERKKDERHIEEEKYRKEKGQDKMIITENCEEKEDITLEEAVKQKQEGQESVKEEKIEQTQENEVRNSNTQKRQHLDYLYEDRCEELRKDKPFLLDNARRQSIESCSFPKANEEFSTKPETDDTIKSTGSDSGVALCSEELAMGSVNQKGNVDEDDVPAVQIFRNPEPKNEPPPVLREIDRQGNETIIKDHSTSAGFTFQNSLIYELD